MKTIIVLSILFSAIALPVFGELTAEDLEKIREIVKSSETELKSDIEKINKQIDAIDARLRTVETEVSEIKGYQTGRQTNLTTTISLIVAIVAVLGLITSQVSQFFKKDYMWESIATDILIRTQSSSGKDPEKQTT